MCRGSSLSPWVQIAAIPMRALAVPAPTSYDNTLP